MTDKDDAATAATNGSLYLYEFLFRGRPPGDPQPTDYHVILAQVVTDAFGQTSTSISQAMTPAQAQAMGFGLPTIVSSIDASILSENAALKAQVVDLQTKLGAAEGASQPTSLDEGTPADT